MDTSGKTKSSQKRNKNVSYLSFPKGILFCRCLLLIFEDFQEYAVCPLKPNSVYTGIY